MTAFRRISSRPHPRYIIQMTISANDTIFALSSGRPPAAIAVVRMSGPRSRDALEHLIGRVPEPRRAALARIRDPATGELIDEALALWFPGPNSETGEDGAELQMHGGRAVIAAVLELLGKCEGFRLAEPGEFTRRAFENGRLDLTQVEALADLVFAETQAQRRQAFGQFRGLLGDRAEAWRRQVIEAQALVEAGIDFSDEGDVPQGLVARAMAIVRPLAAEIAAALAGAARGERLREGLSVAIVGSPNAGKSTLLNRIARREAAIVSPQAGTTRDVIEVYLDLGGYPVTVLDTAGLRQDSGDSVEREGMRRARAAADRADLVLWIVDASTGEDVVHCTSAAEPLAPGAERWRVVNKTDLVSATTISALEAKLAGRGAVYRVSAATGAGVNDLIAAITQRAEDFFTPEPALVTRERQRKALLDVGQALDDALQLAIKGQGEELVAEQLRRAATGLGRLTGRIDVEDVLDVIFRDFCVGK
jgi:tRNA modification GTPase